MKKLIATLTVFTLAFATYAETEVAFDGVWKVFTENDPFNGISITRCAYNSQGEGFLCLANLPNKDSYSLYIGGFASYICEDVRYRVKLDNTEVSHWPSPIVRLLRNRFVAFTYLEFGQIDWQNVGFWHQKPPKTRNFRIL